MTSHLHIICTLTTDFKKNLAEVIKHVVSKTTLIQIESLYLILNVKLITICERTGEWDGGLYQIKFFIFPFKRALEKHCLPLR